MIEILSITNKSKVYRLSPGIIKKVGYISSEESYLQSLASEIGVAPKVYEYDLDYMIMEEVKVYPEIKLLRKDKLDILEKLWSIGISHNDTHIYNWGQSFNNQNYILDFGLASLDKDKLADEMKWCRKLFKSNCFNYQDSNSSNPFFKYQQSDISN